MLHASMAVALACMGLLLGLASAGAVVPAEANASHLRRSLASKKRFKAAKKIKRFSFRKKRNGFKYIDDVFSGTNQPEYASGEYSKVDRALIVNLGGVDDSEIRNMSGGWRKRFRVNRSGRYQIAMTYRLHLSPETGVNDDLWLMLNIDNLPIRQHRKKSIAEVTASADKVAVDTGYKKIKVDLGFLKKGRHVVYVGGFLQSKSSKLAIGRVLIRNIKIRQLRKRTEKTDYEVWASDQSNSVSGQTTLGVKGSFLWIWDQRDILDQLLGKVYEAKSLPCTPGATAGPCDLIDIFPQNLEEYDAEDRPTGSTLADLPLFGRLHGVISDPQQRYVTANTFVRGGGYIGVIDTQTKEAVALFRVTEFEYSTGTVNPTTTRSVHMSFWSSSGDAIFIANLHGKAIERINVSRDRRGKITKLQFDRSASLGLGKGMKVASGATYFKGPNAFGRHLFGEIVGDYAYADLGDMTPNEVCKENGCSGPAAALGGRANNVPICPISSSNDLVYTTLGGGGLFVVDGKTTPMSISGEYGNNVVYGAGCGGVESGGKLYTNAGVSASGAGATQSMFAVWEFDDDSYRGMMNGENDPLPQLLFEDPGNTLTGGNQNGIKAQDTSGQIPGTTTRRDSHGAEVTVNGKFLHVVDRIQNVMEVFNLDTSARGTYDLTSGNGMGSGYGACLSRSVMDDMSLPKNDPAPDLLERSPDGEYMFIAFRGPAPVSVPHAAQGSCPGVGVVQLNSDGSSGRLVDVLRTTNTVEDEIDAFDAPGGAVYSGTERSDVHGAIVVDKTKW